MLSERIQRLFAYNRWANKIILDTTAELSADQYLAPSRFPKGGVRETLFHVYYAEWIWRRRCLGQRPVSQIPKAHDFENIKTLRSEWQLEEKAMQEFLESLNDGDCLRTTSFIDGKGLKREGVLADLLTHVVLQECNIELRLPRC
jgi:uncharacterized damage-inducible protein DinB